MEDLLVHIESIANETGSKFEFEKTDDGTYIDCQLRKGEVSIDIAIPKHDGRYYAYAIESPGLPREIYPDQISDSFTEELRSQEILETIINLLLKKTFFYAQPRFLSRESGYLMLPIDGLVVKIPVKSNYFGLPIEE